MTYPVLGIPNPTDIPSQSQGLIQTNFNNIIGWSGVDHIQYGAVGAGTHNRITILNTMAPPPAQTGSASILYTGVGVAVPASSQLFWVNSQATFQISAVRAWAFCDGVAGGIIGTQSSNVASVVRTSTGTYTVTLSANAVGSAQYAVIGTSTRVNAGTNCVVCNYAITGPATFQFTTIDPIANVTTNTLTFSFMVLQI